MYLNTHFVVTTCTLAFIYLFRNEHFYFVRNMFMVAMGLALVGYVLYPTAPPRMLPELGFVDSVSDFTGVSSDASVNALFNPYAAVPSMHVGFALMLARADDPDRRDGAGSRRCGRSTRRVVTAVVVVTANHWVFDAAAGRGRRRGLRARRADGLRARATRGLGLGARGRGPSRPGAGRIGCRAHGHPTRRTLPARPRVRLPRLPVRDPQPADPVAADAQRDLAHRASRCASSPPC